METPFIQPQLGKTSFNCPYCKAFSNMNWSSTFTRGSVCIDHLNVALCAHCRKYSVWMGDIMSYPSQIEVESPNNDLSDDVKIDYLEAANIMNQSPRGAAALLRLAIEKLVNELESKGKDLNAKIGDLVSKGLNPKIQKALDVVRFIGNEAVHPGQIDLNDSPEITQALFKLVNVIADDMITKPKEVDSLYDKLVPENHKNGINKRDSK